MPTGPEIPTTATDWLPRINARLSELLPPESDTPSQLHAAMRYSVLAPGKRLRPLLTLAFFQAAEGSSDQADSALNAACAVEFVHAFSLIHDDLPAIDNDDLRRGRLTCHKQFDEATAILAGDALFALAFSILTDSNQPQAVKILAEASLRLVKGETQDVLSEGEAPTAENLAFIHRNKTGALIAASAAIGVMVANGSADQIAAANGYGEALGLAFQIADDILNVEGDPEKLGKPVGSDAERKKATYPALYGLDAAKAEAKRLASEAEDRLQIFTGNVAALRELAAFSVERIF